MNWKKLNLSLIKLMKCHIDVEKFDNFVLNLGFISFFGMVFVGIRGFDWRIACIICGIAGLWFCFPRGEGK